MEHQIDMKSAIAQTNAKALEVLGSRWLLHPSNRVQRVPRADSTPILSKGNIVARHFNDLYDLISKFAQTDSNEHKISGYVREIQEAIKVLNAVEKSTIQGCSFNVETNETTIYIAKPLALQATFEKIKYLALNDFVPNQKYSISTEDFAGWMLVFQALAGIKMVSSIGINYAENQIEVN